jgi:transcriptional antiterminator NusG
VIRAVSLRVDQLVRVCAGPFASFRATVAEIDVRAERLKVAVEIYGRRALVELDFGQVEKLQGPMA